VLGPPFGSMPTSGSEWSLTGEGWVVWCAGQPLTREQLIPEVGVLMVAGYDTSSHTIAWTL
jgi:hypothetical protein